MATEPLGGIASELHPSFRRTEQAEQSKRTRLKQSPPPYPATPGQNKPLPSFGLTGRLRMNDCSATLRHPKLMVFGVYELASRTKGHWHFLQCPKNDWRSNLWQC